MNDRHFIALTLLSVMIYGVFSVGESMLFSEDMDTMSAYTAPVAWSSQPYSGVSSPVGSSVSMPAFSMRRGATPLFHHAPVMGVSIPYKTYSANTTAMPTPLFRRGCISPRLLYINRMAEEGEWQIRLWAEI